MTATGEVLRLARLEVEAFEEERRQLDSQRCNLISASNNDPYDKTKATFLHELSEREADFEAAINKWNDLKEERDQSGKADLTKFAEKAKDLAERSASAQVEILSYVKEVEVVSTTGNAYSKVGIFTSHTLSSHLILPSFRRCWFSSPSCQGYS